MLWVIVLHISTVLLWCAALLYLPALISGIDARQAEMSEMRRPFNSIERFVFTHLATPAALIAIMSGTVILLLNHTIDGWLLAKLTLVTGLVACHSLVGAMVLQSEPPNHQYPAEEVAQNHVRKSKSQQQRCRLLLCVQCLLIMAILWLVLAKPSLV